MENTQLIENQSQFLKLLELIERMNRAIERYRNLDEPDEVAIRQYNRLRDEYSNELLALLREGFHLQYQLQNAA